MGVEEAGLEYSLTQLKAAEATTSRDRVRSLWDSECFMAPFGYQTEWEVGESTYMYWLAMHALTIQLLAKAETQNNINDS